MAGPHNTIPPRGQIRALEQEKPKHNRRRRGNSCGQHQSQGQPTTQNDNFNTLAELGNQQSGSGHPGGVPASSAVVPSPGIRSGAKHVNFTRCPCCRLVEHPAPTSLDSCLAFWVSAQHVVPYIRSTQRHSHTYFCELTGSFAACYKVSRRYAGDGSLCLERRSSQPRHGSLRFKRRSVDDGSPRFGRRSPQLRHYPGDRSLRLGRRSSQPRHESPHTKRRPPQSRAAQ